MSDKTCFNINFDSLGWALSANPKDFLDPSFFHIADRFFELSNKYGFKYTIFIIGRDLENPEVREKVGYWASQGHEIANHSYSHMQNLGYLDYNRLEMEVMKSHELITKVCGREPKGFIAPAWATSTSLLNILLKNGYLYDTSVFPSYFMWLVLAKLRWNFRKDKRKITVFQRRDLIANLFADRKPYFSNGKSLIKKDTDGLLILPLPVTPLLRIPCWHTMSFLLPQVFFKFILNSCLSQKYFYYLLHPTDVLEADDIPLKYRHIRNLERMDVSLAQKMQMFHASVETVIRHSSSIVTLEQIAKEIIAEKGNKRK